MSEMIERPAEHGVASFFVDAFGAPHLMYDGWHLTVVRGRYDDVPVLFIDTAAYPEDGPTADTAGGPRCRIILNDSDLWANPPYSLPDDPALLDPDDQPRTPRKH